MLSSPQPSKPIQNQPELKAFPLAPFASMEASAHGELPASLGRLLTLEGASCHRDGRLRRTDYHPLRALLAMGCIKCASPGTGPEGGEKETSFKATHQVIQMLPVGKLPDCKLVLSLGTN